MPSTLTLAKLQDETKTSLGDSGVDVELASKDILKSVKDAIRAYNHARPRHARATIAVTPTVKRYVITHPGLQGVVAVSFINPQSLVQQTADPFDPLTYRTVNPVIPIGMGDRELTLGYLENARNVSGTETEWFGQWENTPAEYALYLDTYVAGMMCGYEYTWHVTPDDDPTTGLSKIDGTDEDWIVDYTLARAKLILSYVRGKFAGIINPEGATDQIDFERLKEEGREDMKDLEEKLKKRRRPLAPVTG